MEQNTQLSAKLKAVHTNLMVNDVPKTLEYYQRIGFEILQKYPEDKPEWARIEKDDITLMFQSTASLQSEFEELKNKSMGAALTIWFHMEGVEDYYHQIKDQVKVLKPLGVTEYNGATEFVIEDINGFILHFSDFQL